MCLKTVPANPKTPNVIDLMNREKSPPVWKNSRNFATPSLVSPRRNDFWGTCPEIPYRLRVTSQICVVLLIGCIKFSACQNYYPDLGSDGSSVWNVCSHSSDVISRAGKPVWRLAKCRLSPKTNVNQVQGAKPKPNFVSGAIIMVKRCSESD